MFREKLIAHHWGEAAYKKFVTYICEEKRNILSARPYFRERQTTFTKYISDAFKERDFKKLYKFRINYEFVNYIMGLHRWGKDLRDVADEITQIRQEVLVINMPLAISRARIFWSRTPQSHLTLMDEVQLCAMGLLSGLDKYTPPPSGFERKFRAVLIGRMIGELIKYFSETIIHFYPGDRRKIYTANKLLRRNSDVIDYDELARQVSETLSKSKNNPLQTTASEIAGLLSSASTVSADTTMVDVVNSENEDVQESVNRFSAPESSRPDVMVEERSVSIALRQAMAQLTTFERKLLQLRGVTA
jgi:DNA-directed RNA polymerase specialized sigma subunit